MVTLARGWVAWKKDNCKDFERAAEPAPEPPPPAPVMRRRPRPGAAVPAVPPEKRVKLGNPELDRLWNLSAGVLFYTVQPTAFTPPP